MKITMQWLAPVIAAVLIYGIAAGQTEPNKKKGGGALSASVVNSDQPVQIEADTLEVLRKENKIIFTGKVMLKRSPTTITCRKLTAFYEEKGMEVKTAICEGDVKVTHNDTFGRCTKAIFDNVGGVITMDGSPVVYQQNQIIRGDSLKYYLNDERITGTNVRFQRNPAPPSIAPKSH